MATLAPPIDADLLRLRHEFLAMPGLTLTVSQAARLLGVRSIHAEELLAALEVERLLMRTGSGTYRRVEPPLA